LVQRVTVASHLQATMREGLGMAAPTQERLPKALDTMANLARDGFKNIDEAEPKHFAAIGKFIVTFATEIDHALNLILENQIGSLELDTGRAVVGEMRSSDVMSILKRIVASRPTGASALPELSELFYEIEVLRGVRDIVTHKSCMVSDNRLAFHNILVAKTGAAIKADIYTLDEVEEFSLYAQRLGFRIAKTFSQTIPTVPLLANVAFAQTSLLTAMSSVAAAMLKKGLVPARKQEPLKAILRNALDAHLEYAKEARKIPETYAAAKTTADRSAVAVMLAMKLLNAPSDSALLEIPLRLRKPARNRDKSQSRSRPPRSSRA
jgi:hypothetical protein